MNISGVLVRAHPARLDGVSRTLAALDGVEVHASEPGGRMVVTIEQENEAELASLLVRMQGLPGVLSASVIYHQFED
jgi:periplasmic nitrate reductase NapD